MNYFAPVLSTVRAFELHLAPYEWVAIKTCADQLAVGGDSLRPGA